MSHTMLHDQKQPSRGDLGKRCSGNMQQIYRRTFDIYLSVSNVSLKLKATISCKNSGTQISDILLSVLSVTIISNYYWPLLSVTMMIMVMNLNIICFDLTEMKRFYFLYFPVFCKNSF